jgi:ribosomal protein S18 acetylase RimI-like enzyme
VRVEDWRATPPDLMAGLFARESARWREALHWDYDDTRRQLEWARTQGLLPGLVARDDGGGASGWSFFLRDGDELQIGGLTAREADVAAALLARVLDSPTARDSRRAMFFGFTAAPALTDALARHGFHVGGYAYLTRDLRAVVGAAAPELPAGLRPWTDGDLIDTARLIQSAYPADDDLRPFGQSRRPGEWLTYVQRLIGTHGCGAFQPSLSLAVPARTPGIAAVALVTRLAPSTVHLAQIAVDPERRGAGLATRLLAETLRTAAAAGYARMTLLVSESNAAARRLYARAGFTESARFVTAARTR